MPESRLLQVEYDEQGMRMMEFSRFCLSHRFGPPTLTFHHYGEEKKIEVPDSLFDVARRIIEEEHMYEYESSYRMEAPGGVRILDGEKWDFTAVFEGKKYIFSSGFCEWPDNPSGLKRIEKLLYNAAKEASVR